MKINKNELIYIFNNKHYITCGVEEKISPLLQYIMWEFKVTEWKYPLRIQKGGDYGYSSLCKKINRKREQYIMRNAECRNIEIKFSETHPLTYDGKGCFLLLC